MRGISKEEFEEAYREGYNYLPFAEATPGAVERSLVEQQADGEIYSLPEEQQIA